MATSAASIALQLQKLSNQATEKSFQYNTKEANTARAWQERMSNTSHQREVQDLIKAGLNPVLSSGGAGAQSYTTSSASAQAENAANAVGNVWSSQIGADATRQAAAASAAATRYAAAQQASAARYAAAMNYQAQADSWKWKTDYMKSEYNEKTKYMKEEYGQKAMIVDKTPPEKLPGLIYKMFDQSGARKDLMNSNLIQNARKAVSTFNNNPLQFFKNVKGNAITDKNFVLNSTGVKKVNSLLNQMNVTPTARAQKLFIKAFVFHDGSALKMLGNLLPKQSNNSARRYSGTLR